MSRKRANTIDQTTMQQWSGQTKTGAKWTIYLGDALQVLKRLPDESFNCVVTSPPYYWLRDYEVDGQIGQEETIDAYVNSIAATMDEVYRVLVPDGLLFLNLGDTYYSGKGKSHGEDPKSNKRRFGLRAVDKSGGMGIGLQRKTIIGIPWRVAIEMIQRNWILRSPIIWHGKQGLSESVIDRPRRSYEYIFMFAKNRYYYFNRGGLHVQRVRLLGEDGNETDDEFDQGEDVWNIVARPKLANGLATAPFPDELVQKCLEIGCPPGGAVLDPFVGGGTTVRVAVETGHPATGIDLNREFCEYAVASLQGM